MQAPILFTPQTVQKNLTEVANKNESSVNKINVDSEKTPFQMALDKQVLAKEDSSQPNQAPAVPIQNKKMHTTTAPGKKATIDQQAMKSELTVGQIDMRPTKQLASGQENLLDLAEPKLDSVATKSSADVKDEIEIIPDGVVNNMIVLMAPISLAPISLAPTNSNILANAKETTLPPLGVAKELTSDKLALVSDDIVLVDEGPDLASGDVADIHSQVDQVLDHSRWLSGVAGKAVSENINASKAMLNLAKDTVGKEMIVTSAIQPQVVQAQSQLAAQQVSQTLNSANIINVYPGKSGWDQAISQKVVWMVGAGEQSASLTLNPPDLGPLKVVIHVHNNQADTTFISDNDEVRRALESGILHLRDKMNETGVQLGQTHISSSNQSQQHFEQAAQNRALAQAQANNNENLQVENVVNIRPTVRTVNGLVDTFV